MKDAENNKELFIEDCQAFNNTLIRRIGDQVYVDSCKGLDDYSNFGFKLVAVYKATREELIASMSGSGKSSTFNIEGTAFFGNAYLVADLNA